MDAATLRLLLTQDRTRREALEQDVAGLRSGVARQLQEILRGEPQAARTRLEPLAGREGGFRVLIESMLARALLEAGDESRARALVGETVVRGRAQGEKLALADALRVQGMVLARLGQNDEAAAVLEEGLELARSLPYPYAEARILEELGLLEQHQGEPDQPQERLEGALLQRHDEVGDVDVVAISRSNHVRSSTCLRASSIVTGNAASSPDATRASASRSTAFASTGSGVISVSSESMSSHSCAASMASGSS